MMADKSIFPIMSGKYLKGIPWSMIAPHEAQAQRNHQQSLERLAQRGGLSPDEALVVIEDRRYDFHASHATHIADELTLISMMAPTKPKPEDAT